MPRFPKCRAYNSTFYTFPCDLQELSQQIGVTEPLAMIPIRKWCQSTGLTLHYAKKLLRKKILLAITYKSRLYVALCPGIKLEQIQEYLH